MRELVEGILISLKRYKTFPLDVLVDALKPAITMVILPAFWLGVGDVGGWSVEKLFLYTAASYLLLVLNIYVAFDVAKDIRTGKFQLLMTRPITPPLLYVGRFIGGAFVSLVAALIVFLFLYVLLGGENVGMFLVGLLLSFLFYLLLGLISGYLAAWMYTIWGITSFLIYLPAMLFGGSLIPLDLLPEPVRVVSTFLPYRYLHYDLVMTLFGREYNPLPLLVWTLLLLFLEPVMRKRATEAMEAWGG